MNYNEFFERFGASYRTKNLTNTNLFSLHGHKERLKCLLQYGCDRKEKNYGNKRKYFLPSKSELPYEYLRLCPWEAEYIFALANLSEVGIVETGRFHGGSTFLLSCANENIPIYSVDIDPQNDNLLKKYFSDKNIGNNTKLIIGDSQNVKYPEVGEIDLLFIDGDHSYEGCMKDFENWYENVVVNGSIVFHDAYFTGERNPTNDVQRSIIDICKKYDVEVVVSPYMTSYYWNNRYGSLCHLIKKS